MNDKQIAPMDSFMERVKQRLRDDIGSLLPDEVLADMVQRVVNDEFFTKKQVNKGNNYNSNWVAEPTEFQEMVVASCIPIIQEQVVKSIKERSEEIDKIIQETVQEGVLKVAFQSIDDIITKSLINSLNNGGISYEIDNYLRNKGFNV